MTDLEFKLYEALRETWGHLSKIYRELDASEPATLGHTPRVELINALGTLSDEIVWPAVFGDDDVIKAMDRERELRNDDTNGMFCGDPAHGGCSWCVDHYGVMHGKPGHVFRNCRICTEQERQARHRHEVAMFAAWSVGSCAPQGDWGPEPEAERQKVLTDDAAYDEWTSRHREFEEARSRGDGLGIACNGTPF